jgi:hypothetical protein
MRISVHKLWHYAQAGCCDPRSPDDGPPTYQEYEDFSCAEPMFNAEELAALVA